jgi:hypothetical protein
LLDCSVIRAAFTLAPLFSCTALAPFLDFSAPIPEIVSKIERLPPRTWVHDLIAPVMEKLAGLVGRGQATGFLRANIDVQRTYLETVSIWISRL